MSAWRTEKLGALCEITSSKRIYYSDYVDRGVPFYRSKEIIESFEGAQIHSELLHISEEKYAEVSGKYGVPVADDILLTSVGTLGVPYLVKSDDRFYFKDGNLTWFRNFASNLNSRYLYYWIQSPSGKGELLSHTIGSSQSAFTIRGLKECKVDIPDVETQRRIAAILSDYDAAIANCRKQIALLEEAAQRLYREWFGDGKGDGEKGPISNWFDVTIGRTPPRKVTAYFSSDQKDMAWCSIADIKNTSVFVSDTAEKLTKNALEDSKVHISPPGTILLSFKLTVGRVAIAATPMATNEAIAHFETDDRAFRDYTYCYLRNFKYETLGSTSAIGTAINSEIVRGMPFVKPGDKILAKFSKVVSPMIDSIENLSQQIRALTEARDRLLPKLMSGEVAA